MAAEGPRLAVSKTAFSTASAWGVDLHTGSAVGAGESLPTVKDIVWKVSYKESLAEISCNGGR